MGTARILVAKGDGQFDIVDQPPLPSLTQLITGNFYSDPRFPGTGPVADALAWNSNYFYWYRLNSEMRLDRRERDTLTFKPGRLQVAGNFSNGTYDDVFFLDEFQNASFLGTNGAGDFVKLMPDPFVSEVSLVRDGLAYSRVARGRFTASAYDSLFLYSPIDHAAAFYTTDGRGVPVRINSPLRANRFPVLQNDYRSAIAGRFLTNAGPTDWDDILIYRARTGHGSLCTTDGVGDLQPTGLIERVPVDLGADAGEFWRAGNFTGTSATDIATYNSATGILTVHALTDGAFRVKGSKPVGAGWEIVQPGRFSPGQLTDLLLFRD